MKKIFLFFITIILICSISTVASNQTNANVANEDNNKTNESNTEIDIKTYEIDSKTYKEYIEIRGKIVTNSQLAAKEVASAYIYAWAYFNTFINDVEEHNFKHYRNFLDNCKQKNNMEVFIYKDLIQNVSNLYHFKNLIPENNIKNILNLFDERLSIFELCLDAQEKIYKPIGIFHEKLKPSYTTVSKIDETLTVGFNLRKPSYATVSKTDVSKYQAKITL